RSPDNIWDFATYNSYSLDQFDWAGNIAPLSPYFQDHVHFNPTLGHHITREIFDHPDKNPAPRGIKLSEDNFEKMAAKLRQDHTKFKAIYAQWMDADS